MKLIRRSKRAFALLLLLMLVTMNFSNVLAANGGASHINRFNVVILLDASNSMNYTDKNNLRYEAIDQFTNLLAEKGNYLGGVVFSNKVEKSQAPTEVTSQEDKQNVVQLLQSFMSTGVTSDMGYTNIGDGLMESVNILKTKGSSDLPSVIVFLSDGNTEMPTDEEQTASLDKKAEAIQLARESGVQIYTVCLNENSKADVSEMEQISKATGGEFREVTKADDLQEVFNLFYAMIYGTETIPLVDDVFPADGILKTNFEVPGIGVEEVNIVINGATQEISFISPDGSGANYSEYSSNHYTFIKMRDLVAGQWTLVTKGVPGDHIKINMIYNTNLGITLETSPSADITTSDDVLVKATLTSGNITATSAEQYTGYEATLHIMDAYGEEIESVPMTVKDNHFETTYRFDEGAFYINVDVKGNYLEKVSDDLGPVEVSVKTEEPAPKVVNNEPEAIENPVTERVAIWPIKGAHLVIDMSSLAKDVEDTTLKYKIVSSSFIEGKDYTVDGNVINMDHFSLSTGSFDIKATDKGGLSCNVEVIVKSYNVGLMTLIGLGIAILIALIIVGFNIWYWTRKPFRGTVSAQSYCNGTYRGQPRAKKRGRIKLSAFGMDPTGLDYNRSYVQATGSNFVYLVTDKPVLWNGQKTNRVRVQGGAEVTITVNEGDGRLLYIRFDSRVKGNARRQPSGASKMGRRKPTRR